MMEKQSVTIYTVAREARVSMATVSRVVNGNPNVKPATRQKVLDVIKKLNYRPNAVARGLASKKTTTVGVVIPAITNTYFAELAQGIDDIATMYKYNIVLTNTDLGGQKTVQVVRGLLAKQVDGIIFMGRDVSDELREEFDSSTVPVVVAGSVTNDAKLPTVRIDYRTASRQAVERLANLTHEPVAMIVDAKNTKIFSDYYLPGYQEALQNTGQDYDDKLVFAAHESYDQAYKLAQEVLQSGAKAAFVTGDDMAAGLLNGLTDAGVKVPNDFQIISGHDTQITRLVRPMLTSITQPLYDIGAVAMRLLTKLMDKKDNESESKDENDVLLEHGFSVRQSTR